MVLKNLRKENKEKEARMSESPFMERERLKQLAEEFPQGIFAQINAVLEGGKPNEYNQRVLLGAAKMVEEFPDIFDPREPVDLTPTR